MRRITLSVLALSLVGATSCVAYDDAGYRNPPGTPPDYDSPNQGGYQTPPPPPPSDYRGPGDYQDPYRQQQPYDSRYPGYDDRYDNSYRSPSYEVGFFYNELSPYGEWVFTYDYGWAWFPRHVRAGWRPYTYGRWVPSDYGWLWVSYEPFGWATYHYGRWAWDTRLGWIWVPGRTWGPAWVSWQYGQGYVGWAPLPPEVGFEIGFGLRIGDFNLSIGISPSWYTFVGERYFLDDNPYSYAVPTVRNTTIIQNTTNITNYTYVDNRVINRGVDVQRIERATGKRVRQVRVQKSETAPREAKVSGDQIVVYEAPRTKIETVKIDDSKPRKKGIGRERMRNEPPGQADRRRDDTQGRQPEARVNEPRPDQPQQRDERRERTEPQRGPMNEPTDLEVAPRARQEARGRDEQEIRREQEKEQQQLRAFQREEQQRLEREQREEKQKAKDRAQAEAVAKRHEQEKQALQQEQRQQEQQLQAKQEVERKSAKANPPGRQKADDKKDQDKSKGKKQKPEDEEPPPPHR